MLLFLPAAALASPCAPDEKLAVSCGEVALCVRNDPSTERSWTRARLLAAADGSPGAALVNAGLYRWRVGQATWRGVLGFYGRQTWTLLHTPDGWGLHVFRPAGSTSISCDEPTVDEAVLARLPVAEVDVGAAQALVRTRIATSCSVLDWPSDDLDLDALLELAVAAETACP